MTPYGTVGQQVDLGIPGVEPWRYCNPLAYLRYISILNHVFGEVMKSCIEYGQALTFILYTDELCPANPFRPGKVRKPQGIFWYILQWPDWIFKWSAMWLVLGVIRSATIDKMPGGISAFYARILELCFLDSDRTMSNGAQLLHSGEVCSATFKHAGLLADGDCLKKVHGYKGAQGLTPCMDSGNLMRVKNLALVLAAGKHLSVATLDGIEFNKH